MAAWFPYLCEEKLCDVIYAPELPAGSGRGWDLTWNYTVIELLSDLHESLVHDSPSQQVHEGAFLGPDTE